MYIIKRFDGKIVADQNKREGKSYTTKLKYAKTYQTFEAAKTDLCKSNECIVEVANV